MKSIVCWILFLTVPAILNAADPDPVAIARQLVDESQAPEVRQALIDKHPGLAAEILTAMGAETQVGTPQEYERIPWIWRVAVAAGKSNAGAEMHEVLQATLPQDGEPLRDWQAVVIGGGIINGIGVAGVAPRARIEELLKSDADTLARYQRCLKQAAAMAEDVRIREGTRYDAMRIIAMQPWEVCGPQLSGYLKKGVSEELQAGAISGSLDVPDAAAFEAVIRGVPDYPVSNRDLALDGAMRTRLGRKAVLLGLLNGQVTPEMLGPQRLKQLHQFVSELPVK